MAGWLTDKLAGWLTGWLAACAVAPNEMCWIFEGMWIYCFFYAYGAKWIDLNRRARGDGLERSWVGRCAKWNVFHMLYYGNVYILLCLRRKTTCSQCWDIWKTYFFGACGAIRNVFIVGICKQKTYIFWCLRRKTTCFQVWNIWKQSYLLVPAAQTPMFSLLESVKKHIFFGACGAKRHVFKTTCFHVSAQGSRTSRVPWMTPGRQTL